LRIKQRREFLRVQRGGRKHHVRHFIVFALPRRSDASTPTRASEASESTPTRESAGASDSASQTESPTRLGITVTRKIGNAVARNRIKRLVREVFRQHRQRLPAGLDLVWVAKQQAAQASFADVLDDFEALVRRGPQLGARSNEDGRGARRRGSR
jgi:ribonuclease P protein component